MTEPVQDPVKDSTDAWQGKFYQEAMDYRNEVHKAIRKLLVYRVAHPEELESPILDALLLEVDEAIKHYGQRIAALKLKAILVSLRNVTEWAEPVKFLSDMVGMLNPPPLPPEQRRIMPNIDWEQTRLEIEAVEEAEQQRRREQEKVQEKKEREKDIRAMATVVLSHLSRHHEDDLSDVEARAYRRAKQILEI